MSSPDVFSFQSMLQAFFFFLLLLEIGYKGFNDFQIWDLFNVAYSSMWFVQVT
jgi:hypothetical protein